MITPNKFISFDNSILRRLQSILSIEADEITVLELYSKTKKHFDTIDQFIYALDVLQILEKITVDFDLGLIHYVN